jgi:hypothetical protein
MLSVGPQELVILRFLLRFWIGFGSVKFSRTTRDLGQLLGDTERSSRRRSQASSPKRGQ